MEKHNYGMTTSDASISLAEILKTVVYQKAEEMLQFKNAIPMQTLSGLDYKFVVPTDWKFEAEEIAEGARAGLKNMTTFEVSGSLKKYQIPIFMTDEAKARQIENSQMQISLDAAAAGLAYKKDSEISSTIYSAAGLTQAATTYWDAAGADPATDIANSIGQILSNTTITDSEINGINLFYPAALFGHTAKPLQIGDVQESLRSWVKKEYNIGLYPTRMYTTNAVAVVNTPRMGVHYTHDGSKIPGNEQYRMEGAGDAWIITQYFKSVIIPSASGGSTSKYICALTGVDA